MSNWTNLGPAAAAFCASLVEFVEALTVVLAVGSVRGWRAALTGAGTALCVLASSTALVGPRLARVPLELLQLIIGALLLLFGMRWLRKAVLRAAGVIALHDESAAFAAQTQQLRHAGPRGAGFDALAFATAFKITLLEGIEVVFIVIALGAGDRSALLPAARGALAALAVVAGVGAVVHRPLARVPENTLKFLVGVLLSAFGTFWVAEGLHMPWPGGDWSLPGVIAAFFAAALCGVRWCRR